MHDRDRNIRALVRACRNRDDTGDLFAALGRSCPHREGGLGIRSRRLGRREQRHDRDREDESAAYLHRMAPFCRICDRRGRSVSDPHRMPCVLPYGRWKPNDDEGGRYAARCRASTLPGRAPLGFPASTTSTPLTTTESIPSLYRKGSKYVALS